MSRRLVASDSRTCDRRLRFSARAVRPHRSHHFGLSRRDAKLFGQRHPLRRRGDGLLLQRCQTANKFNDREQRRTGIQPPPSQHPTKTASQYRTSSPTDHFSGQFPDHHPGDDWRRHSPNKPTPYRVTTPAYTPIFTSPRQNWKSGIHRPPPNLQQSYTYNE